MEMIEEKDKYEALYTTKNYRIGPFPGVQNGLVFLTRYLLGYKSLIDFGCGSGDAAMMFATLGYDVFLVDIADNCLDPINLRTLQGKFWVAPLHELPSDLPGADWGYCTDVMEHIPEHLVVPTLKAIRTRVPRVFFSICDKPDTGGSLIGEQLHLTIQPVDWWAGEIRKHWTHVEVLENMGSSFVVVGRVL